MNDKEFNENNTLLQRYLKESSLSFDEIVAISVFSY